MNERISELEDHVHRPWSLYHGAPGESPALFAIYDDAHDRFSEEIRRGKPLKPHTRLAMMLLEADDLFIDIGANIGTFSIPVTLQTGAGCLDVEALPSNVELLKASLAANGVENHRVEAVAALDEHKSVHVKHTSAFGTVNQSGVGVEVPAVPLDACVVGTPFENATLVKIDIEGSEQRALSGLKQFFTSPPAYVIFEANGAHCFANGYTPQDLIEFFEKRGYQVYLTGDGYLVPRTSTDFQEQALADYLATMKRVDSLNGFDIAEIPLDSRIRSVVSAASHPTRDYRAFMAAQLERAPTQLAKSSEVRNVLRELANDRSQRVRDALSAWCDEP